MKHKDSRFIDLVRSTLERVESSELAGDKKSAVPQLRRSVVRIIAEHEVRKSTLDPLPEPSGEQEPAA